MPTAGRRRRRKWTWLNGLTLLSVLCPTLVGACAGKPTTHSGAASGPARHAEASPSTPLSPGELVIEKAQWASARELPAGLRWGRSLSESCVANHGCGYHPLELPRCPKGLRPLSVEGVFGNLAQLLGQRVLVRGKVHRQVVPYLTVMHYCPGCCNTEEDWLTLGFHHKRRLALWDEARAAGFRCHADDSRMCCTLEPNREVVAYRTLVRRDPVKRVCRDVDDPYFLLNPLLSDPARPDGADTTDLPTVTFERHDARCMYEGRRYTAREAFQVGDQTCGCYRQRLFCQPHPTSDCFRTGRWYENGTTLPKGGQCGVVQCEAGAWRYRTQDCQGFGADVVEFGCGKARIEPRSYPALDEMARFALKYPRFGVSVTAYADVYEARHAAELARRRAEAVKHALWRNRQVPADRITLESRVLRGKDTTGRKKGPRPAGWCADIKLIDPPLAPGAGPP